MKCAGLECMDGAMIWLGAIAVQFLLVRITAEEQYVVDMSDPTSITSCTLDKHTFPLILGIAGGSGSGKTTLAKAIMSELGDDYAAIINHDCYYKDSSHLTLAQRAELNFDHPSSLDTAYLVQQIKALKNNQSVYVPQYDYATHSRVNTTRLILPKPVIIIEGILIFADSDLLPLLDIKVYVDTEDDIRLARRIERDSIERNRTLKSILQQYFKTVRPMHQEFVAPSRNRADIIVPIGLNSVALDLIVYRLRAAILQHTKSQTHSVEDVIEKMTDKI